MSKLYAITPVPFPVRAGYGKHVLLWLQWVGGLLIPASFPVGSGCGGSVVASRLSETGASVLLLEAGDSAPPEAAVPGLSPLMMLRDNDWYYHYTPQRNGMFGYNNNVS